MNKNLLRCCTYVIATLLMGSGIMNAQIWKDPMADNSVNFYTIQQQFNHDMRFKAREMQREASRNSGNTTTAKGGAAQEEGEESEAGMEGYLQYKRWEYFTEPRVYPSGDLSLTSTNWTRFQDYLNNNPTAMQMYQQGQGNHSAQRNSGPNSVQSSTWTFAGPTGAPTGAGAGRVGFIRVDPTNANNLWIGAPAGGLWKSTNGGTSWTTNTDFLALIGASDVAIDPTNTQNMYLATGDGDAGDTYSMGVMKSTDGGTTWVNTGLTWTPNQGRIIRKLLMMPGTPTTIMAFSNAGIWRTTNGGTSWTQVLTNSCTDAEFMPGTPNTVYACGTSFFKSTDGGATWATITTGVPAAASVDRLAIAVTAASTGTIYMIAGSAANDGFFGFYKSTNSGTSFTTVTVSSPSNMLGWATAGNDVGGQGWYDLVIDCSPTNANEVCVGGVNIWRTTNGGTSWTLNGHWTGTGAPYVHADHHAMVYVNATTMLEGCDGGIFKTTNNGTAWSDISNNLCIAQIYRIGLSASTLNYWITGHQDNGTNLKNGAAYTGTMGGDGMDCFVDRTNNNVMYGEQYQGSLNRTTNGGTTWTGITTGLTGTAPWVTPWYQDPTTANTLYCGRTLLFKSTNQGTNWAATTGALPGTGTVVDFKIAPSNNQVIYVVKSNAVYKTVNGGGAWTTITGTLPVGSAAISRVDVKPTDPLVAVVTFSGYSSGNKVFKTINGGTTWTNISTGLPNLPCNCVRFDASSAIEGVYVGCDVGVYYTDNTFAGVWQPYFTSLPNAPIFDLEVYTPTGKLRAATYGRGIWEVDIYNPGTLPPVAQFSASSYITCVGAPVNFTDLSSFTPTTWAWTFPSGTPATSTTQNPAGVTWAAAGTYTVSLVVSNANGTSSPATAVVTVLGSQAPPLVEGFEAATFLPTGWTANNINNDAMFWTQATTGAASTKSALFDNYNNDVGGARDEMWAPRMNCTGYTTLTMTFDVAYARYDATYSDSLQVLVSTDCGSTWTSVYLKGGTLAAGNLATAADQTATIFVPTAAQWRNESVNLNAYAGQSSVLVVFRNRGHYGQALYVDNINITGTASAIPSATFTASTTTVCAGTPVSFTDASSGTPTSWSWTFPSGTPASATTQNVASVIWNTAGTYTVTHTATNVNGTGTTTQVITVNALPTVTATTGTSSICAGGSATITAAGASTYAWMPGSLSGTSVTVTPAATTTYTVTGTSAAGCVNTATQLITVNPSPTVTVSATATTICAGGSTTITAAGATTYTWMPGSLTGTSVTVTPAATTTYTVTGTTAGCTATATQLITVTPSPTVTTTATSTTICSGNSTTITAAGATTYTWMPGSLTGTSVTVTPATTTTYTVTGTSGSCTGTATRTITVNPSPTVTVSATSTGICVGGSTTLTATGGTTYTWMPGSLTGTSVTVTPAATTTYTVTGTTGGCTGTATQIITVSPTPTVTTTATSTTICAGSSTTITAAGATTYAWMPGSLTGTSVTVTPATTTTYTVTGTTGGCTSTATRIITVNPSPTVTVSATATTICSGSSTTITATGATTYAWMPGSLTGTSVTVTPATTTTYTVTGTAAGCTATATQLITVTPTPTVTTTATSTTICSGTSTTITATGATTYLWNPGALTGTSVTVTPATTTTYTVTGTSGSCTGTATRTITVNPSPTVTTTTTGATICSGSSTTITGAGASTYAWMPGSLTGTTVTVTPATTTTYTVTGTAANGCTGTATRVITVNPTPTVTATASSTSICSGNSVTLSATGATTYLWNPGALSGASVTTTPGATTTYTVTGTSAGCTSTATVTVTVGAPPTITASAASPSICNGSSTTITAVGGATYLWMPGSLTGASISVTPATTTSYTVTGSSGPGCSGTATVTVTVNPIPTITATNSGGTICSGNSTTITAAGGSTYAWMPGSLTGTTVTVNPTTTTTYTVTGTTAAGCSNTATNTITVNPTPTVTTTATATSICSGNSVSITANGATTYNWMPGSLSGATVSVNPATTTTYTVTGTDVSGCSSNTTQLITVNPTPTVTATSSNSNVCTATTVTLTASGATTYNWMPGNISGSPITDTPTSTTTYTVTGTDPSGCTSTAMVTVSVNPTPTVTATISSASICSGNTITLTASGATTYNWMPGNINGSPVTDTPVANTTYTVTGTDPSGCTGTATVAVTIAPSPTVTATISSASVCAGTSVVLTANGATTYTWQPINLTGSSVSDTPTSNTTYTVTGSDPSGCVSTATVAVNVNANPTVTATSSSNAVCFGTGVTLTGTGASTYVWQPINMTGSTINDTPTGTTTYTLTGTDANGCIGTDTANVSVYFQPTISITGVTLICPGNTVTLVASGGATYSWQPGGQTTPSITDTPVVATTYTVTGTDVSGCYNTATHTVSIDTPPTTPNISVNGSVLTSTVTGNSYQWFLNGTPISGATSQSYTATGLGSYTVEVYDLAGCGSGQSTPIVDPTGIDGNTNVDFISVLPNPNDGHFVLSFHASKTDNYVVEIHDMLGQIIYSEALNNFNGTYTHDVDLSIYSRGVYTIKLRSSTNETVVKSVTY